MDLGSLGHMIHKLLNKKHAHFFPNETFILKRSRIFFTNNTYNTLKRCVTRHRCSLNMYIFNQTMLFKIEEALKCVTFKVVSTHSSFIFSLFPRRRLFGFSYISLFFLPDTGEDSLRCCDVLPTALKHQQPYPLPANIFVMSLHFPPEASLILIRSLVRHHRIFSSSSLCCVFY